MELLQEYKYLQTAATTGNGTVVNLGGTQRETVIYLRVDGTVGAGAVQIETADSDTYSGTWAPLGSALTLVTNTTTVVQVTGPLLWVRARISTNITGGGTLTATLLAN